MTREGLRVFSRAEQAAGRNAERHVPAGKSGRSLRVTAHKRELVGLGAKEMTSARRLYQFWKLGSRDRLGIYLVGVRGGRFVARAPRRRPAAVGQAANAPRSRRPPELRAGAAAEREGRRAGLSASPGATAPRLAIRAERPAGSRRSPATPRGRRPLQQPPDRRAPIRRRAEPSRQAMARRGRPAVRRVARASSTPRTCSDTLRRPLAFAAMLRMSICIH
jgi:hypothetical protein